MCDRMYYLPCQQRAATRTRTTSLHEVLRSEARQANLILQQKSGVAQIYDGLNLPSK
jgi:hypothetical protein